MSDLNIGKLRQKYADGSLAPSDVAAEIHARILRRGVEPVWIHLESIASLMERAAELERAGPEGKALYGIPFAIKDNIDWAGRPTTAGCPDYAYTPDRTAFVVQRLLDAGAMLIGKTNLDQFATGLVGVRSPYGACGSVFDERYLSGGSSSGSAVAVAADLVSFSLGTDTAGSGRVPAAFNNIIGLKPSRGLFSASGVVPACRTLDCVSVFTKDCAGAAEVFDVACCFDLADGYARAWNDLRSVSWPEHGFRFGVPRRNQLQFFGDTEAALLYDKALEKLGSLGGVAVEIDFSPFRETAELLYAGPWVAERLAAIEAFLDRTPESVHQVVRGIITGGRRYSAVDAWRAMYKLAELQRAAESAWKTIDLLALPTTGTIYTREDVEADPVRLNTNLGFYTNFVNLLDLSAVAVPAGFRPNGLPFGISLIAPAFADRSLLALGARYEGQAAPIKQGGRVEVAVVGAHLTGQPLNHQLTERGGWLVESTTTAAGYRLYALAGGGIAKPGLVREPGFTGPGIEVEVWSLPEPLFGGFVAAIPPPLGIGSCELVSGRTVKCFICEPYAIADAKEITSFGGWRAYLAGK